MYLVAIDVDLTGLNFSLTLCVYCVVRPLTEQEINGADSVSQVIAMKELSSSSRPNSANSTKTIQTTPMSSKFEDANSLLFLSIIVPCKVYETAETVK